jgi:methyltransferase (TIGR00027 family)
MRKNQTSMTAMGIAIVRGIESEKPADERICYDPYARRFVNSFLYHFVRFFDKLGYSEVKGPGVMGFLAARDRHIDEFLKSQIAEGIQQVVILGAGLDSRAYRFPELKRIKVFEVDHPASQQTKIARVREVFGSVPAHVVYVSIDFNTETLAKRLAAYGYDETLKTCFIWQGVTQYLNAAAVDETLSFIAQHSGTGSAVIFDYMYPALLDGTIKRGEVTNMRNKQWVSGEVMTFGIPEGKVTEFLEQRGFTQIQNADHARLHDLYFTGANARRTVAYGYAVVSAVVKIQSKL